VLVVLVVVVVVVVVVVMAVLCCYNTVTDLTITGSAVAVLCDIRHDVRHQHLAPADSAITPAGFQRVESPRLLKAVLRR
jgi:hypothetical protein